MKKLILSILIAATAALSAQAKSLVVYLSQPENVATKGANDAVSGASVVVRDSTKYGNVEYMAKIIQRETGADIFQLETEKPYPREHKALVDAVHAEQKSRVHPKLKTHTNVADYDTIILCYPIWSYALPFPVHAFLDEYDLGGKTVHLAVVHGGSRLCNTDKEIAAAEPRAALGKTPLVISRNDVAKSEKQIADWARKL